MRNSFHLERADHGDAVFGGNGGGPVFGDGKGEVFDGGDAVFPEADAVADLGGGVDPRFPAVAPEGDAVGEVVQPGAAF